MSDLPWRDVTIHEAGSWTACRGGPGVGVDKYKPGTLGGMDTIVEVCGPLVKLRREGVPMENTTGDGTACVFSRVNIRLAGLHLGVQEVEDGRIQISPVGRVFEIISHLSGLAVVVCGQHPADGAGHILRLQVPQDAVLEVVALVCKVLPFHKDAHCV